MIRERRSVWVMVSLLACCVLAACSAAPTVTPVARLTDLAQAPTTVVQAGQPTASAADQGEGPPASPTTPATPTVVPTPLPPQPPRMIWRSPERGEELRADGHLVLGFDQPMDRASTEQALTISPSVDGSIVWDQPDRMRFVPGELGFQRDLVYRVSLDGTAQSASGLQMTQDESFQVRTVGYLEATGVFPQADSEDVVTEGLSIRVIFNRPVVPLVSIASQSGLPQPLSFEPPVAGEGTWINSSIYSFEPSEPLLPATRYEATVAAGLMDATGGILAEALDWAFTTQQPRVVQVSPLDGARHADPGAPIAITYNQEMNRAETQALFALLPAGGGAPIAGSFDWDGAEMRFAPTVALERGKAYGGRLAKGAPSKTGAASIAEPFSWSFTVAARPRVTTTQPRNGSEGVEQWEGIEINFSSPISTETLYDGLIISPTLEYYAHWRNEDTQVRLSTYLKPSTTYSVTLTEAVLGRYGEPIHESITFGFGTAPLAPMVQMQVPGVMGTYSAHGDLRLLVSHRNVARVDLALHKVPAADFLLLNREDFWSLWDEYRPSSDQLLRRWSEEADAPLNVIGTISTTLRDAEGERLAPGYYHVSATGPGVEYSQRHLLVVSPINLTLKHAPGEALVWATDLKSGLPIEGLPLTVYDAQGKSIAEIETDSDGVAETEIPAQEPWKPLTVQSRDETQLGAVVRGWSRGIEPYAYGFPVSSSTETHRVYLYTDRRIYRPGQTVYYKGVLRQDDDGRYSLPPAGQTAEMVLTDSQGREVWREMRELSDMGTLSGQVVLGEEAGLGHYRLYTTFGVDEEQGYYPYGTDFEVAEYRKPEFQVHVALSADEYLAGETIEASLEASYFFGGPLAEANVSWRVMALPYTFDRWSGQGYYEFGDRTQDEGRPGRYQEFVTEGEGVTDAQGRLVFEIPAEIAAQGGSQVYTVEASVVDLNHQEVTARTGSIVHQGDLYVGLGATRYVGEASQEQAVRVLTLDTRGITVTQKSVEVVFSRHEWFSARERAEDGNFYWTNKVRDTAVATRTVKTDGRGTALASFVPSEGGTYKVVATARDRRGNQVRSAMLLWISGEGYINWGQRNNDRLELVADKKGYRPGDIATILVPSPYREATIALMSIERGKVLDHRLLRIEDNSSQIQLPILSEYVPNVYVSVVLIAAEGADGSAAGLKLGYVELPVSSERRELQLTITSDKEAAYQPREQVVYDVEARDSRGRGVETEVSLQLVDLAVQSLVGDQGPGIVDAFYRQRPLGVLTAASLAMSVDRVNMVESEEGKGGGGGPEGATREVFPDTAFWAPHVRTDAQGHAQVSLVLPDSLTTWRMTAQGVTADTRVGQADTDIVTTLDIMIRPAVPRFLVVGDAPVMGAIVHNNTEQDRDMVATLTGRGIHVGASRQQLSVPAQGRAQVSWPAEVLVGDDAELVFSLESDHLGDAVTLHLPIRRASYPEVVGTSGQVEDRVIQVVQLPEDLDTTQGELSVLLEPSLAAGMMEGLDYLRAYPYDCIEQAVSRFLPNVVLYRALSSMNAIPSDWEASLPQTVALGMQRIYALQNLDGGWGWWAGHVSSPELAAYVVLGLDEAREAGFVVDERVLDRGISYLYAWLDTPQEDSARHRDLRATVLYALAEAGQGDLGRSVALYEEREGLSLYAKGYLAMALQTLEPDQPMRSRALINELIDAAILSSTGAHWEEGSRAAWAMNTDTRTTAIVLRALVRVAPEQAETVASQAVRWLMTARKSGRWESTQETVWSILALTDYMSMTGEMEAQYSYLLTLNGSDLARGAANAANLDRPVQRRVPISSLDAQQNHHLLIDRTAGGRTSAGSGNLYYSAFLRYFLPAAQVAPLNRGIIVQRQLTSKDQQTAVSEAQVNDILTVNLTLIAPTDLYFVALEAPLPSGCEAIDPRLATTRSDVANGGLVRTDVERGQEAWWGMRSWPSHIELRDDRLALFATHLPKGTYEYSYAIRCTTPGQFQLLPARAYEMYAADVFGHSSGGELSIGSD